MFLLTFGSHTHTLQLPFEIKEPKLFAAGVACAGASLISAYYSLTGLFRDISTVEKLKKEIIYNGGKLYLISDMKFSYGTYYVTERLKMDFSNDLPKDKIRTLQAKFNDICKIENDKTSEYLFYFSFITAVLGIGIFVEQNQMP